jgi:predicted dehydrogenase
VTSEGHQAAFREFLLALDDGRAPAIDGYEARKAVEIILAIYTSAGSGGEPMRLQSR